MYQIYTDGATSKKGLGGQKVVCWAILKDVDYASIIAPH